MEERRDEPFMNETEIQTIILSGLFEGMEAEEAEDLLLRLRPERASFDKDEFILESGDCPGVIGMLLSGAAQVLKEDFWGRQTVLSRLEPGDIFAETYALLPDVPMEAGVLASEPSEVLFLDATQTLRPCGEGPHALLVQNLLAMVARKNLILARQAEILAKRTIRERLMTYLSAESFHRGLTRFEIPFSRQELADHLSVDRSALSNEISKMKEDGVIRCERRTFVLPLKENP